MQTSHSKNSMYVACPKHWDLSYNEKWEAQQSGASTYFGSAIDAAVTEMLEKKPDWLKTFYDRWNKAWSFGVATQIFDNPDVVFGHKDFDIDVLEDKDIPTCQAWAQQLNLIQPNVVLTRNDVDSLHGTLSKKKKNPYITMSKDELTLFNRLSWISMKRKGKLLLNAFHSQFYPKIKKVIATQQRATIQDPATGDSIVGFIDMILEIDGYAKPIIFDLKTASQPYNQEDIDLTQQLTLYAAMKGQDHNTDLVGYVVLSKNISKKITSTCKICQNTKTGKHKTCEAVVNGVRCNGDWDEKIIPDPQVQVLVEKKTPAQVNDLLLDIGNIVLAMKNGIVYKNVSKCNNWYGGKCPMYDACHKGDYSSLRKKK